MVLVLYGSVSGSALELAEIVLDKLRRRKGIHDLDFVPFGVSSLESIEKHTHVFILCSTTGDGELPPNTQPLWSQLLKKNLNNSLSSSVKFYCFGLGSSAYPKYNYAIRKIFARFKQLGAEPGLAVSDVDENNADTYSHFEQWLELALEQLDSDLNLVQDPLDRLLDPLRPLQTEKYIKMESSNPLESSIKRSLLKAEIKTNNRLTHADHFQDVRHVSIKPALNQEYEPGDVVCLYPANNSKHVDALLQSQKWTEIADETIIVPTVKEGYNYEPEGGWVQPLTLRNLITWHLDLNCVPSAQFYNLAKHFCTNPDHQIRMQELANDEEDRYGYSVRVKRTVIEVILEFDSIEIPIVYLLDLLRLITPRQYSISSPKNQAEIELTVAVVKYNTFLRRLRRGICTSWLANQCAGAEIYFSIKRNGLDLIRKSETLDPVVLVATGTGIAPIRSLILSQPRFQHKPLLFHGIRNSEMDHIYCSELSELAELVPAYSRQGSSKRYVQDEIVSNKDKLGNLGNALVFVCGSAGKMPLAVQDALQQVVIANNEGNADSAYKLMLRKQKLGTYIQETW